VVKAHAERPKRKRRLPAGRTPTSIPAPCIGAEGYGLDKGQQEAVVRLWTWQERSLRGDLVLGGPIAQMTNSPY
jgi:hypothetical protein